MLVCENLLDVIYDDRYLNSRVKHLGSSVIWLLNLRAGCYENSVQVKILFTTNVNLNYAAETWLSSSAYYAYYHNVGNCMKSQQVYVCS